MDEPVLVVEQEPVGLYRSFSICATETQKPVEGFEALAMDQASAVEFARKLSTAETEEEIESIRREAKLKSDQVQFDLYHL